MNKNNNNSHLINDIKESVNIIDIISSIITLKKKGNNFFGICPFHPDSTPSLTVSGQKQIYKCFVCNKGGDVINFVKSYYHLTLWESLQKINEISNFKFNIPQNNINNKNNELLENHIVKINLKANAFFQFNLINSENIFKNYLQKNRNLNLKTITKYNIGCSTPDNNLKDFLNAHNFSDSDILSSNLISISKNGDSFKDFFINRIIFPIKNEFGIVVGFSGRSIKNNSSAKYLNSKESQIFQKNKLLYNFYNAKRSKTLLSQKRLFIVEGFMDVIALDLIGYNNAIAIMGLSISQWQIDKIKSLSNNIVLFLDNDLAGIASSFKFIDTFIKNDFNIKIIDNKTQKDAYDLYHFNGQDHLKEIIEKQIEWYQFKFNFIINIKKPEKDKLKLILKLYNSIKTKIIKNDLLNYIKNHDLKIYNRFIQIISNDFTKYNPQTSDDNLILVKLLMTSKFYTSLYKNKINFIPDENLNIIASYIVKYYNRHDCLNEDDIMGFFNEEINNQKIKVQAFKILKEVIKEFDSVIKNIITSMKEKHIVEVKEDILKEKNLELKKIKISTLTKLTKF